MFALNARSTAELDTVTSDYLLTITIITKHMAICRSCQSYYKKNQWNQSDECSDCAYTADVPLFDEEDSLEVEHLLNPSGRTLPRFNE